MKLEIRRIDGQAELILPDEVLEQLRIKHGDSVHLAKFADGYLLTADAGLAASVEAGSELMDEYRETFRGLAKSDEHR